MNQLISNTPVTFTSFTFQRGVWLYTANRIATGQWSIIRRKKDNAPIPPYMRHLNLDGEFHPVIGNDRLQVMYFADGEKAVQHIEDNF